MTGNLYVDTVLIIAGPILLAIFLSRLAPIKLSPPRLPHINTEWSQDDVEEVKPKLKPHPDPIPTLYYGEVVDDIDNNEPIVGLLDEGHVQDEHGDRIREAFWDELKKNGGIAPTFWKTE